MRRVVLTWHTVQNIQTCGGMRAMGIKQNLGIAALSIGMLGVVGGIAAANAFQPVAKPAPAKVQLVQPAAETVTPSPTTTTVVKVAPKPVAKPAPVKSVRKQAPAKVAPQTVQRQAVVSEQPVTPEPSPTPKYGTNPVNGAPNPPPVDPGQQPTPPPSN